MSFIALDPPPWGGDRFGDGIPSANRARHAFCSCVGTAEVDSEARLCCTATRDMLLAAATALGRTAATLQCRTAWCRDFGVFARRVYARPDYTPYAGFSRSAVHAVDLAALIPQVRKLKFTARSILMPAQLLVNVHLRGSQRLKEAAAGDKTLPATVILHGLLGSANNWRSLINRDDLLAGRFVCALDLRNHGRSPHSDSMTYQEMAADGAAMSSGESASSALFDMTRSRARNARARRTEC